MGSMTDTSNWLEAAASGPISVTRKREKCAVMPATCAIIAKVGGSRTESDDDVIMLRRLRVTLPLPFARPSSPLATGAFRHYHPIPLRWRNSVLHTAYNLFDMLLFSATYDNILGRLADRDPRSTTDAQSRAEVKEILIASNATIIRKVFDSKTFLPRPRRALRLPRS